MYVRGDYSKPSFAVTVPSLLTDDRSDCPPDHQIIEFLTVANYDRFLDLKLSTPPDQVLQLLADPRPEELERFGAWQANHATTLIHTDVSIYECYGVNTYTEFDVFQKEGDAGYNAYLNRLCGLPELTPHYNLAYNLTERLDPAKVIHTQQHHNYGGVMSETSHVNITKYYVSLITHQLSRIG